MTLPYRRSTSGATPPGGAAQRGAALVAKRAVDVTVAGAALVGGAPLMAGIALAIKLGSRGPVLFRQTRLGRDGRQFEVLKFRSMVHGADEEAHRAFVTTLLRGGDGEHRDVDMFKLGGDPRVTRVGGVLRRYSLDELPQLVNVLRGEMSLVGPRPEVVYAVDEYAPWHWRRFDVLPGMTGLWQVSGRATLSPLDMLRLDVEYADNWTFWLDLRLLLRTVPVVIRRVGSR